MPIAHGSTGPDSKSEAFSPELVEVITSSAAAFFAAGREPTPDWQDQAAEILAQAGPVALANGTYFLTLPMPGATGGPGPTPAPSERRPRVGRNDPCPCGSGRKLKKCCRMAAAAVS